MFLPVFSLLGMQIITSRVNLIYVSLAASHSNQLRNAVALNILFKPK